MKRARDSCRFEYRAAGMVSEPGGGTQLDQAVILIAACKAIVTNDLA